MDIDHTIDRIVNPVFVPAIQVPVAPVVPPGVVVGQDPVVPQLAEADGDADSNPSKEAEPIPAIDVDGDLQYPVPVIQAQYKFRYKKVELRKFKGDPAEFPGWLNSFLFNVNSEGGIPGEMKLDQFLAAV